MRVAAYMYMYVGGGCTEPTELARKAAEQPAEWAAEGEGGQPRNTRLVITVGGGCVCQVRKLYIYELLTTATLTDERSEVCGLVS